MVNVIESSFSRRSSATGNVTLDLAPRVKAYPVHMERNGLLIGAVAARSGLSRKALRLYEARGILPPPRREPSGYRRYPVDVLKLLTFVGQARRLGLTLSEIKHIVVLRRSGPRRAGIFAHCWNRKRPILKACSPACAASLARGVRTDATRRSVRISKREEVTANGTDLALSGVYRLSGSRR